MSFLKADGSDPAVVLDEDGTRASRIVFQDKSQGQRPPAPKALRPGAAVGATSSPTSTSRPDESSPPPQLIGKIPERPKDYEAPISSHNTAHENFDPRPNPPPAPPVPPRDLVAGDDERGNLTSEWFWPFLSLPMFMQTSVH